MAGQPFTTTTSGSRRRHRSLEAAHGALRTGNLALIGPRAARLLIRQKSPPPAASGAPTHRQIRGIASSWRSPARAGTLVALNHLWGAWLSPRPVNRGVLKPMKRLILRTAMAASVAALASLPLAHSATAQDTIKVGILHSLSGTMAISETTLKDVMLMLIEEQNKNGGLLGKKLEAVVVDPASNWPLFAEKARELISKEKVASVFGCWTSVSRKSVLPVFKELNSILFYPVQYEGEESERNVFYTGAAPNQQ